MANSNATRRGGRTRYMGSAATALALMTMGANVSAFAQDTTDADTEELSLEEIVVTGSLIRNPNLTRSNPVAVVSPEEMTYRNTNVVEEVLRTIPGVVPAIGAQVNNGNGGFATVDLRGLGTNRNVALVDGVRMSPSTLTGVFDTNNIPIALLERVDVLTGGASTTYGADAISGVVNFITRKNFSGVEVNASYGVTEKGDGDTKRFEITMGGNIEDKGNVVVSLGYQKSDPVYMGDRDYGEYSLSGADGSRGGSGLGSFNSRFGNVNPTGGDNANLGLGGVQPDRTFAAAFTAYNFSPLNVYQTPFERYNVYASANYDIAENVEIYTRGIYSRNTVNTLIAPSGSFGDSVTVALNHSLMSDAQRNAFCAFDTDPTVGVYSPLYTQAQCDAAATATGPADPNYLEVDTQLRRRNVEGGPRISDFTADYFDFQLGLRGDFNETLSWDVMASHGESKQVQTQKGYWLKSRFRNSLLGCPTTSDGCIPVDFFGPTGSITEEQNAYLSGGESAITTNFAMSQIKGSVSGEVGFTMPWASEAVNFAVAGEYRKYKATRESDLLSQSGDLGGAGGAAPNIDGGFSVYEGVAEFVVPIVTDASWAKQLNFEAGLRYSEYSVDDPSEPKFDTTTWKMGLSWAPTDDLSFRGTFARAVRAPNIFELFNPVTTGLTNLNNDPCASVDDNGVIYNSGPTGVVRDVCIAQGAPVTSIGFIPDPAAGQANNTTGGNLALVPEKSDSWTLGMIITPAAIPGLTMTVDYYNIKIDGSISAPAPDDALAACFDNPSTTSEACRAIVRSPIDGGLSGDEAVVKGLPTFLSNSGNLRTDGIDVTVSYGHAISDSVDWNMAFAGNWTNKATFQAITGSSLNRDCVGLYSANCGSANGQIQPKFTWNMRNTFTYEQFDLSVLWRHIDGVKYEFADTAPLYSGDVEGLGTHDFNRVKAFDYFDLSVRYHVFENVALTGTVTNLFNKRPPITSNDSGTTAANSGNTFPSTYDALGRRYGINAKITF
ncbi:TonB-dependent receptor plug domain-containing protein [Kordiimonas sp.]|uniref:TonB-dependent receptor plug domain-containing protein n=1 Tax=Kordiimonas sp. TaxID=1970157 RepID=UPI003A8F3D20